MPGREAAIPGTQGFGDQSVPWSPSPPLMPGTVTVLARDNGAAKDAFRGHEHGVTVWDYYNLGPESPALSHPVGFGLLTHLSRVIGGASKYLLLLFGC